MNKVVVGQVFRHETSELVSPYSREEKAVTKYLRILSVNGTAIEYLSGTHPGNLTDKELGSVGQLQKEIVAGKMVLVKDVVVPAHLPKSRLLEID